MAQENVLSISLKEYKKEIDDLKGSLLGLQKGSDDYNKIVQQVRDKQDKLNEVLTDCKRGTDAAANSMNALKEHLAEMKKEVGNLDVGSDKFKELSKEILDTTNKLKELEASQGTFSRNVGNYAGSICDAFESMGIKVGGLKTAFNAATTASGTFSKALDVLKAHPIIAVISAVVIILMKIKDAINQNEKASNAWKQGMAAFQPILDAFNRILGVIAEALAVAFQWLGQQMPKATEFCGKALNGLIGAVGWLVKAFINFNTFIPRLFGMAVEQIGKALTWVTDKIAAVVDTIPGLGDVAEKLKNIGKSAGDYLKSIGTGTVDLINKATGAVDNLTSKAQAAVDKMSANLAQKMQANIKYEKDRQALVEKTRQQEELRAKSELKQAELRDQISMASGKKKLELLAELRKEVEANGKREVEIAKETLRLAEFRAAQAPNSGEDNDRLAKLKANVVKAEAEYTQSFVKIDKMATSTSESMAKAEETAQTKRTAAATKAAKEREKAEKEALKAQEKAQKEYLDNFKANLKNMEDASKAAQKIISSNEKIDDVSGALDPQKQIAYENQRYAIVQETNQKINAAYEEAINSGNLSAEQKLQLIAQYSTQLQDQQVAFAEHTAAVLKYNLEDIRNTEDAALNVEEMKNNAQEIADKYTEIFANLYEADPEQATSMIDKLNITDEQKEEILANLETMHQDMLNGTSAYFLAEEEQEHQHQLNLIAIKQEALQQMLDAGLDPNSEEALARKQEIDLALEAEAMRHTQQMVKAEENELKATKAHAQKTKQIYSQLSKAMSSIFSTIAGMMKDNIDAKVESGEMSEEEAKKEFERVKALQIVSAVINTIEGAITAYTTAQSLGPIAGPIVGGINAAAVTAMGIAQIAQIKKQQYSSSSSASVNGSNAGTREAKAVDFSGVSVNPLIDENADLNNMTSLSEQKDGNSDQRVYILQSDIDDSNKQVEIRQSNTTF